MGGPQLKSWGPGGAGPSQLLFSVRGRLGFPGGTDGKESSCNVGDLGSIPGLGRSSGGGHGNPFQYSCLEDPHGQRSLVGYTAHEVTKSLLYHCATWEARLYNINSIN